MRGGYLYILGGGMADCVRGRWRGNCDGIGHGGSGYGDDMAGCTTNGTLTTDCTDLHRFFITAALWRAAQPMDSAHESTRILQLQEGLIATN